MLILPKITIRVYVSVSALDVFQRERRAKRRLSRITCTLSYARRPRPTFGLFRVEAGQTCWLTAVEDCGEKGTVKMASTWHTLTIAAA